MNYFYNDNEIKHVGGESCRQASERLPKLINRYLNILFKGKSKLGDLFDWWVSSCEASWCQWKDEYENDIPNCRACSLFVKNSKITFIIEGKIGFSPSNKEKKKQYDT
jgi:hypothetical protein